VLAALLRRRDASALRKLHFMALCQRWRYRADAWVPREVARKRAREASPQPHARAPPQQQALVLSAWPLPQVLPDSSTDALCSALHRQLQKYIFFTNDARVYAAAQREPRAQVLLWSVTLQDSLLAVMRSFAAVTAADAAALTTRCHDLNTGAADAEALRWTPWWLSDDCDLLLRTDSHFALVKTMMQAFFAGMRSLHRAGAPPLSAPDAAIQEGFTGSMSALDAMVSIGLSAQAQARISLPTQGYLRIAAEALSMLATTTQYMIRLHEGRRAWCATREAASPAKGTLMAGAFWPTVANVAREQVIPLAGYTQPRLSYALEVFAFTAATDPRLPPAATW
jgi:hypothetical protein